MQSNKIKKISIKGFRGVKDQLKIDLNTQSLLIYGDNATGKSTVTDSVEWFLYDKISHLRGEGILKHEGIRNKDLDDQEASEVSMEFSDVSLNSNKQLMIKNKHCVSEYSNTKNDFKNYLDSIPLENLLIRNDELISFIISTKSKRLADISKLIGYSEVSKTKSVLKQSVSDLNNLIKHRDFDNRVSLKQKDLLDCTHASIHSEVQFFSAINGLCKDLKLEFKIDSWESFNNLEREISKTKLDPKLQLKNNIVKILSSIEEKLIIFKKMCENLKLFQSSFQKIFEDRSKLKGVKIKSLLKVAEHTIKSKVLDEQDKCPLCLQSISYEDLLHLIDKRLKELKRLETEIESLKTLKNDIVDDVKEMGEFLRDTQNLEYTDTLDFNNLKNTIEILLKDFRNAYQIFSNELNFVNAKYYDEYINKVISLSLEKVKKTLETFKDSIKEPRNSIINLANKIHLAKKSFLDIQKLQQEKKELEFQERTMNRIYNSFSKYQKEEMELFLSSISSEMNIFFQFMYPNDNIKNIQLTPMSDNEEDIVGISYHLNFRGAQLDHPKKLLSESYLNCLGLCLFLSSVKLFNKKNKFFILDDVISSFDKNHRLLFGRLLVEKFSDWQIIVLTHENEWFKYLSFLVKSKNWMIKQIKWDHQIGSFLDQTFIDLKEEIEDQIKKSKVNGLGNKIRRYLENLLKDVCENLGAETKFKRGDRNEKRSLDALYSSLRKRLKNKKTGLENCQVITNLRTSQFFGNETSHDNNFDESLADLRACFADIKEFKQLFVCSKTGEFLSEKYIADGKIKTKSGHLSYTWK